MTNETVGRFWLGTVPQRSTPDPARAGIDDPQFPECSGDPADCPENEGYGCCKAAARTQP